MNLTYKSGFARNEIAIKLSVTSIPLGRHDDSLIRVQSMMEGKHHG